MKKKQNIQKEVKQILVVKKAIAPGTKQSLTWSRGRIKRFARVATKVKTATYPRVTSENNSVKLGFLGVGTVFLCFLF